ncbi:MAG: hypothetical protein RMH97_01675 [Verrucomicrobiales bacterium]|nr:hypothetical protein [Verrucomicrobiales bacterium]
MNGRCELITLGMGNAAAQQNLENGIWGTHSLPILGLPAIGKIFNTLLRICDVNCVSTRLTKHPKSNKLL